MEENLDYKAIIDGVEKVGRFGKSAIWRRLLDSASDANEFLHYYRHQLGGRMS